MATALDVINSALKEIGVLAAGETATADDSGDGLTTLNRVIDGMAAEPLQIYTVTRTEWTIAASTQQYTVGSGATVNVARPVSVNHIRYQDTSPDTDTEYPLHVLTEDEWAAIRLKDQTASLPTDAYYNPTFSSGNATIDLWPIPTSTTLQGVLYAPEPVAQLSALSTAISMPPGYERMLVKNLAVELMPTYGRRPSLLLIQQAQNATAVVKRANKRLNDLSLDPGALIGRNNSGYNIRTG